MLYKFMFFCFLFAIQYSNTPLYEAANENHTEVVLLLLQAGGNPNIANNVMYCDIICCLMA